MGANSGRLRVERRAADNKYLHRDFHCALDQGLRYLGELYGDDAVSDFLKKFAKGFYAPLIAKTRDIGFAALRQHIAETYVIEEAPDDVAFSETDCELRVRVSACPAVAYMKSVGHAPSKWYAQTTSTVNEAIADELGCGFQMISYDEETGAAEYRFFKRENRGGEHP